MAKNNADKEPTTFKATMTVVAFIVSLIFMFTAAVVANQYRNIRPYKTLAAELNDTLGGGYKISYTWACGLESSNCPSARMIKDADFKGNDEAEALLKLYKEVLSSKGYSETGFGICKEQPGIKIYCTLEAKKEGKTITVNTKQDFIGVDITP